MDFRGITPKRRRNPTTVTNYQDYKSELREDFQERCGYCNDWDYFRMTYYEVDHFVPRHLLKTIKITDYSNLVYSCRSCNNTKRAKWPTGNEQKHNDGTVGFMDPCCDGYAEQFVRNDDGSIAPRTKLGQWMFKALNLSNPSHRIIWQLTALRFKISELQAYLDTHSQDMAICKRLCDFNAKYHYYEDSLREIMNK